MKFYTLLFISTILFVTNCYSDGWILYDSKTNDVSIYELVYWNPLDIRYPKYEYHWYANINSGNQTRYFSYKYAVVHSGPEGENIDLSPLTTTPLTYYVTWKWDGPGNPPYTTHSIYCSGNLESEASAITTGITENEANAEASSSQIIGCKIFKTENGVTTSNEKWTRGDTGAKGKKVIANPSNLLTNWSSINVGVTLSITPSFSANVEWNNPANEGSSFSSHHELLNNPIADEAGNADIWTFKFFDGGFKTIKLQANGIVFPFIGNSYSWTSGIFYFYY